MGKMSKILKLENIDDLCYKNYGDDDEKNTAFAFNFTRWM